MNNVERFQKTMNFEPVDKMPVVEWANWWDQTLTRWYGEGLPAELKDPGEIRDYLGLDCYRQLWVRARGDGCPKPAYHGAPIV